MASMKAWSYQSYGSPDVLKLQDLPIPLIELHQVLVQVKAAALNPIDFKRGLGYFRQTDSQLPIVPGCDVAGIVVKVGAHVHSFKEGDEVYGDVIEHVVDHPQQFGSLAEYVAVDEKLLALKPNTLTFEEAASLPLALETAFQAFEEVGFKAGQSVLIVGGAGGVGTLAIQLAKFYYGASLVATTASAPKHALVKSLGADVAIDYRTTKYEELPDKYDFVFDVIGECEKAVKAVKQGGKAITIASAPHPPAKQYVLISRGSDLLKLSKYIEDRRIKPLLDPKSPFKFVDVVEAFQYLETSQATGKIVISPIHA